MVAPWSLVAFWDAFLVGLAITCAVEVPAYLGAFAAVGWVKRDRGPLNRWSAIAKAIVVNVITVPFLWRFVLRGPDPGALLLAVLGVAAIEGALIFAVVRRRGKYPEGRGNRMLWCATIAIGVNALSLLVGLRALPLFTAPPTLVSG